MEAARASRELGDDNGKVPVEGFGRGEGLATLVVRTRSDADPSQLSAAIEAVGGRVVSSGHGTIIVEASAEIAASISRIPGIYDVARPRPMSLKPSSTK